MCTTLTHDVDATIRQIERLQEVGCEIARVAVPDKRAGEALKEVVRRSILPIVRESFRPKLRSGPRREVHSWPHPGNTTQ